MKPKTSRLYAVRGAGDRVRGEWLSTRLRGNRRPVSLSFKRHGSAGCGGLMDKWGRTRPSITGSKAVQTVRELSIDLAAERV